MNDQSNTSVFINNRHEYLERWALNPDNEWYRCYRGMHVDEKAELLSFRRQVRALERETITPRERLKADFDAMTPQEREAILDELINGGA